MIVLKSLGNDRYDGLEAASAIARQIGWGAADILQSFYTGIDASQLNIRDKRGEPVTAADIAVNNYIVEKLQENFGSEDIGYLTEETYKPPVGTTKSDALPQSWVWIIDPLDGTRDFIERTGEFSVHIALTYQGSPVLTVVTYPEVQKSYWAIKGGGSFVETRDGKSQKLQVSERDRWQDLSLVVSRTHRDERFNLLLQKLPAQNKLYVGSVGCKIAAIVEQQADIYISLSGKSAAKDWDMAAPELILTEAGGQFTYLDGTPLKYNRGDVHQWGCLIASNGICHSALLAEVKKILDEIDGKVG